MGDTVEGYLGLFEILFSVLKKMFGSLLQAVGIKIYADTNMGILF
jgi:hypothetical protein